MNSRDLVSCLQDILEVIDAIEQFIDGVSYEDFLNNREKQFAVERGIERIGEAVKNIPDEIRQQYSDIPWKQIAGMRDKIAHRYWQIDSEMVWQVTQRDIPVLKGYITMILTQVYES